MPSRSLREDARTIWQAAVDAARPEDLLRSAFDDPALPLRREMEKASRIVVVGGGKAGAAMSAALEKVASPFLDKFEGLVNVPAESVRPLHKILLHPARPAGSNEPTAEGVTGTARILELVAGAGPEDMVLCLLSGGGSALLPAPVPGISLQEKQEITRLLHACGATINEMNAVRKHLSAIKGGRLVQNFRGRFFCSLILSDVIGDPLDVIASGPTAADSSTFQDALNVLEKYQIVRQSPPGVLNYLKRGAAGQEPETLKVLPKTVVNAIVGNNAKSLHAAQAMAEKLNYNVLNLGPYLEGETRHVAKVMAGIVRGIKAGGPPLPPPACVLSGGETTVTLGADHGRGGRNQEFVLATLLCFGPKHLGSCAILSGGTDGEDGPTDAAGATADESTFRAAAALKLDPADFLRRHDAYSFFHATGDLLRTGLTQTNVMDIRVILVDEVEGD